MLFLVRHGRSTANEADVIISKMESGVLAKYGLTEIGMHQADEAGKKLADVLTSLSIDCVQVHTSPFSRCIQTAEKVASHIGIDSTNESEFIISQELRERDFGLHEGQSTACYDIVWKDDLLDPTTKPSGGGESVQDVAHRMSDYVQTLERDRHHVIVSHGDALSILAAVVLKTGLEGHRRHGLPNCGILTVDR